jgi:TolA-binding protein
MLTKILLISLFFVSSLVSKEISVLSAGNMSSPNPYGLTSTEKHILRNKNKLDNFDTNVKGVKSSVGMVAERIDGLESVVEGNSKRLHKVSYSLNGLSKIIDLNTKRNSKKDLDVKNLMDNIKVIVDQLLEEQAMIIQNQEKIKKAQSGLTKLANKINMEYISQSELKSNMSQFVTQKQFDKLLTLIDKKPIIKKTAKKKYKSKKQKIEEARVYFKKKFFDKAIPLFEELVEANYRPAESNYMLGEMWYVRKKYKKAIEYFKTSGMLYDKGWWMPNLLLHSAVSFEKIDDIDNAALFYSSLIDIYPKSKQAKQTKKNISQ